MKKISIEHWQNHFQMKMFIKELFNPSNILIYNQEHKLIGINHGK